MLVSLFRISFRRANQVRALGERAADGGVDVRRRAHGGREVGRLEPKHPVVVPLRIERQRPQQVFGLAGVGSRDDQVLPALRDFGLRRDEVERRRLTDVDACPVRALQLQREVERPLAARRPARAPIRAASSARSASAFVVTAASV